MVIWISSLENHTGNAERPALTTIEFLTTLSYCIDKRFKGNLDVLSDYALNPPKLPGDLAVSTAYIGTADSSVARCDVNDIVRW